MLRTSNTSGANQGSVALGRENAQIIPNRLTSLNVSKTRSLTLRLLDGAYLRLSAASITDSSIDELAPFDRLTRWVAI